MNGIRNKQERDRDIPLFNRVYQDQHKVLYAYLLGHLGDAESAADLLQETCVRAWRHIADLRAMPDDNRRFWLLRVARNLTNDHYRRQAVRGRAEEALIVSADTTAPIGDPAAALESREMKSSVDAAMARLPVELRTVLTMQVMSGLNSTEIGKALGKRAGTVRYQISEARRRITEDLTQSGMIQPKEGAETV